MGNIKYLIRLDDACPTMNKDAWTTVETILDRYGVKPMVGVIPKNEDKDLHHAKPDDLFWKKVHCWESKGWAIALHGYDHCCKSKSGGINPLWTRSEFAGLPLKEQSDKIRKGVAVFEQHGISPKYFFAPSHTFDENTLKALKENSGIRIISDTIAFEPYICEDFVIIPQMGGHCVEMKLAGTYTFCLHPSNMRQTDFDSLENFLDKHYLEFVSFSDLDLTGLKKKPLKSKLLSKLYFLRRKIKGIS